MAFNIRVYGILLNDRNEVLLSDESRFGRKFTKFPGGGLEQGEGLKDCVKREFMEELQLDVEVGVLVYLTDFYQQSAFNENDQIISIYYRVHTSMTSKIETVKTPFDFKSEDQEVHRWISLKDLTKEDLTFPIDKKVVSILTDL
jgi:8-oxo-dGTP pyrophosphatase MutT (NUDIX family)